MKSSSNIESSTTVKKIFIILIFISLIAYAQTSNNIYKKNNFYTDLMFDRLSIEHGLSQITVHAILQDSKGFLWFGTEDGLNRYDGYNLENFWRFWF